MAGAQRVSTKLAIDDRRDKEITMDGKIRAVEEKMRPPHIGIEEK